MHQLYERVDTYVIPAAAVVLLGEMPVLTPRAPKVARPRTDSKSTSSRIEMEEWLLLYGIERAAGKIPVHSGVEAAFNVLSSTAYSHSALRNDTAVFTSKTTDVTPYRGLLE